MNNFAEYVEMVVTMKIPVCRILKKNPINYNETNDFVTTRGAFK